MRFIHAFPILLALGACGAAQRPLASAEIPFLFRDGFIWVDVNVSGSDRPLHFLLDSGAQVSVIDCNAAQKLGLKRGRLVTVEGVGTTATGFWPQTLDARAGRLQLPRNYLMLDLHTLAEACTNATVDGIIGADFFRDRTVQIDFQKQALRILQQPTIEAGTQVLPLKVGRCGMLVPIQVNGGAPQWVRLDTGCASALQWVSTSARAEGCTERIAIGLSRIRVSVTNTTVILAGRRFEHVSTDLRGEEIFPGEKGLLGNGLLARYNTITVDAKGGKLFLH